MRIKTPERNADVSSLSVMVRQASVGITQLGHCVVFEENEVSQ